MCVHVLVCQNEHLWNALVFRSKLTLPDHFWHLANVHYILSDEKSYILLPFVNRNILGFKALLSYGLRMSGGPAPLKYHPLSFCVNSTYKALSLLVETENYDIVSITTKLYSNKFYVLLIKELVNKFSKNSNLKMLVHMLKARILFADDRSYDHLWQKLYNKKVRNTVRKFIRWGGKVKVLEEPLVHVKDILRCNLSSPQRQGRPLPSSYINPTLVYRSLKLYVDKYMKYGKFYVYGAFLDNELVGYSYILLHNGHAYVSRFIVDLKYGRYCVGEGLLDGILKDLVESKFVKKIQYAYWSPLSAPGVDHFLKQFGFTIGKELVIFVLNKSVPLEFFMRFFLKLKVHEIGKISKYLKHKKFYFVVRPLKNLFMRFLI